MCNKNRALVKLSNLEQKLEQGCLFGGPKAAGVLCLGRGSTAMMSLNLVEIRAYLKELLEGNKCAVKAGKKKSVEVSAMRFDGEA